MQQETKQAQHHALLNIYVPISFSQTSRTANLAQPLSPIYIICLCFMSGLIF